MEETIQKIESILQSAEHLPQEKKEALLALLKELKQELSNPSTIDPTDAKSVAGHAHQVVEESIKTERDSTRVDASQKGLEESVRSFEASHPRLMEIINQINLTLSNLGL